MMPFHVFVFVVYVVVSLVFVPFTSNPMDAVTSHAATVVVVAHLNHITKTPDCNRFIA
jgi:hypothetical protein